MARSSADERLRQNEHLRAVCRNEDTPPAVHPGHTAVLTRSSAALWPEPISALLAAPPSWPARVALAYNDPVIDIASKCPAVHLNPAKTEVQLASARYFYFPSSSFSRASSCSIRSFCFCIVFLNPSFAFSPAAISRS